MPGYRAWLTCGFFHVLPDPAGFFFAVQNHFGKKNKEESLDITVK